MQQSTRWADRGPACLYAAVAFCLLIQPARLEAQQPLAAAAPPPCMGYAYNLRPSFFLPEGIPVVVEVQQGSPAEAAGLRSGDILFTIDGERMGSSTPSAALVPGDTVELVVHRGDDDAVLSVVVGERVPAAPATPAELVCLPVRRATGGR